MFKWLRNKLLKGSKEEFEKGLDRNTNFLEFAKSFSNNSSEINDTIYALESENMRLWTFGYNDQTMSKLLDLDMNCRRMFANVYGGSDLKYNKKFDPKPEDLIKKNTSEDKNEEPVEDDIEDIANDIHKKFHKTCDVLKKIKKKTTTSQLVSLLSKSKIELDDGFASRNKTSMDYERQIILDIGNWKCMPMIEAEEYRNFDFKKYSFRLSTSKDFAGLMLSFDYTDQKKRIQLVDFEKAFKLSKTTMRPIGENAEELYDLIVKKGKFDETDKRL